MQTYFWAITACRYLDLSFLLNMAYTIVLYTILPVRMPRS